MKWIKIITFAYIFIVSEAYLRQTRPLSRLKLLHSIQTTENTELDLLMKEREKKRLEYLASDLAVKNFQRKHSLHKFDNATETEIETASTLMKIDIPVGFSSSQYLNVSATGVPMSAVRLAIMSFQSEFNNILKLFSNFSFNDTNEINNPSSSSFSSSKDKKLFLQQTREITKQFKLSNQGVWDREKQRKEIIAPWIIKLPYYLLCYLLDTLFDGNPISRFYFLETVARMPYFSYITMLHTYETLGWWRRSTEAKRIHFAEEYNEYHHLLIMESLGGDQEWFVRFFAQHSSIIYYFVLIAVWILSPTLAYNFSELIEAHAVDTYTEFLESNKDLLQRIAAPTVAKSYYESLDMYIFDEFQTDRIKGSRRPVVNTLYDVFCNIRDDENEHVKTMSACQDPDILLRSPNTEAAIVTSALSLLTLSYLVDSGISGEMSVTEILTDITTKADSARIETMIDMDEEIMSKYPLIKSILNTPTVSKVLEVLSKIWPIFEL